MNSTDPETTMKHQQKPRIRNGLYGLRPGNEMDQEIRICTWNLQSLNTCSKQDLRRILSEYKADITALQETRKIGTTEEKDRSKYQCDIYFSGNPNKREFGVGFAVKGKARFCINRWVPINERICMLRIKAKFYYISIICAHAPTLDSDESEKDNFYDQLERTYDTIPAYDMKIVLGDYNAKVGQEQQFFGTIGKHSLHTDTNDNGMRLITFAASRNMVISSTNFPHPNIHKHTWKSPDGVTKNQIDHVLCDRRHSGNILDVRSMRGADLSSDHYLVRAKIRCRIASTKSPTNTPQRYYNLEALKTEETARRFEESITGKLSTLPENIDIESHWKLCAETITSSAIEVLGKPVRPRTVPWRDREYDEAVASKEEAHRRYLNLGTRSNLDAYRQKRREAVKLYRQKKRRYKNNEVQNLEILRDRNQTRKFYQGVNKQRKGHQPITSTCNDKNGNLITEEQKVLDRWKEFLEELLNGDGSRTTPHPENSSTYGNNEDIPPPTLEEVQKAIHSMKNNKSAGSDGIPAELLKAAGANFISAFHQLLCKIWNAETMPEEWNHSIICPIHKKGDKNECSNYRGISLLNIAYKVLAFILCERLKPHVIRIIGNYQCGFMPGRGTSDQIFTLRQILEKTQEFQVDTHHLFIDFKQAYDTPTRQELFKAMNRFGIPSKLIKLSQMTLENTWSSVRAAGKISEKFRTIRGFRQGDALSCSFFNILLEMIMASANINTTNIIYNKTSQILAYADDIDVIGRSTSVVTDKFLAIEKAANSVGLKVNGDKTKYMLSSKHQNRHNDLGTHVNMGPHSIEVVKNFIYLGSEVTSENDISVEIKRRIVLASRCLGGLRKLLRSTYLSHKTKLQLYHQLIQPVLVYGAETWNLKSSDEQNLLVFERKILRLIYGPIHEPEGWRILYNHELQQLYQHASIVDKIRAKRLRWAGHVQRMEPDLPARKVFTSNPNGGRRPGRPKTRWIDLVDGDARMLGISNWRTTALNREVWRRHVDEAESL